MMFDCYGSVIQCKACILLLCCYVPIGTLPRDRSPSCRGPEGQFFRKIVSFQKTRDRSTIKWINNIVCVCKPKYEVTSHFYYSCPPKLLLPLSQLSFVALLSDLQVNLLVRPLAPLPSILTTFVAEYCSIAIYIYRCLVHPLAPMPIDCGPSFKGPKVRHCKTRQHSPYT